MRIEIATLFPEMCERVLDESIIGRARRRASCASTAEISGTIRWTSTAGWTILPTAAARAC